MKAFKSEFSEQAALIKWARDTFPNMLIFAIPNGGKRRKIEARRLVTSGVISGIPDLCIIHKGNIAFLEMKQIDGKLSANQKKIILTIEENGILTLVGYGAEDARQKIINWIGRGEL